MGDSQSGLLFQAAIEAPLHVTKMVPELITCNQCGRHVIVLSWSPIYDDAAELLSLDDSHTLQISCKIDCPQCGTLIQSVKPSASVNGSESAA
jgi:hypothetical protein